MPTSSMLVRVGGGSHGLSTERWSHEAQRTKPKKKSRNPDLNKYFILKEKGLGSRSNRNGIRDACSTADIFRLFPYTAERRDVLENTLPEAQEISQGREFCTPRPKRLPEGESRVQSRGPRGAKSPSEGNLEGRGGCIFQCIPTRGSVQTFFQH